MRIVVASSWYLFSTQDIKHCIYGYCLQAKCCTSYVYQTQSHIYLRLLLTSFRRLRRSSLLEKEKVEKLKDDGYRMQVKVPAENNLANTRGLELCREMF